MGENEADEAKPERSNKDYLVYALGIGAFSIGSLMTFVLADRVSANRSTSPAELQMHFAAAASAGILTVFSLAMGMRFFARGEEQAKAAADVMDVCKTVFPPIIALIFGYYFGKSAGDSAAAAAENSASAAAHAGASPSSQPPLHSPPIAPSAPAPF